MVVRSTAVNNLFGLAATAATMRVSQSTVTGNTTGLTTNNGGTIGSYTDNLVDGNAGGEAFTGTIAKK